jgi:UDP-glucose:(heptosyl)LPS alpha-1,3-glucosyltransferase
VRIALVVERIAPAGGGVEQVAWSVAEGLRRAGDDVVVFCRSAADPPADVAIRCLPVADAWQPVRVLAFSRRAAAATRARAPGFDVVHALTRTRSQDLYRAGAGRHADSMRHTYGARGAAWRRLSPRHLVALAADRRIFGDPTQWIQCPSALVRDEIVDGARIDPERVVVIPNGVDPDRFHPGRDAGAESIRSRHAHGGETAWLFAGSGGRRKGLDVAIRALALHRDPQAVLWVAGRDDPASWRRLARRFDVAGRVRFLGPRDDMPAVYRAADGLLLPTRYDPFANACLEAAASGLAIVSTRRNGAMEVIREGGIAVRDPDDARAVAAALDRLADRDVRRAMGADARKRALACDWPSHVERLRALYERVVARRSAAGAAGR